MCVLFLCQSESAAKAQISSLSSWLICFLFLLFPKISSLTRKRFKDYFFLFFLETHQNPALATLKSSVIIEAEEEKPNAQSSLWWKSNRAAASWLSSREECALAGERRRLLRLPTRRKASSPRLASCTHGEPGMWASWVWRHSACLCRAQGTGLKGSLDVFTWSTFTEISKFQY